MPAETVAKALAKGLRKRKSVMTLSTLGKATVWMQKRFPRLLDRLTYGYIARETDSPFK